jgi:L-histidine N-alpha-methyltransferase
VVFERSSIFTGRLFDVAERPVAPGRTTGFLADVVAGLSGRPKRLPAKYFYDVTGSSLFEEITRLPEYYPTRDETAILSGKGTRIRAIVPSGAALIEFGSGASTKIRILLDHLPDLAVYVPIDVSGELLAAEAQTLRRDFPRLSVRPVMGDFMGDFTLPFEAIGLPKVGFFPGSTIGNFEKPLAAKFLAHAREVLGPEGLLIVGVDLVKDKGVLNAAYNDDAGATARFNLNLLARINRELGADFELQSFAHRAFYNSRHSRIEMHLLSRTRQDVRVGTHLFAFEQGETIHTENSYKYTVRGFHDLASAVGWQPSEVWTDPERRFSVHVLSPAGRWLSPPGHSQSQAVELAGALSQEKKVLGGPVENLGRLADPSLDRLEG